MALPVMTAEQRADALAKAAKARADRAALKAELKSGDITLDAALARDCAAKMKVAALLTALPGVGKVRAAKAMGQAGIQENRRVRSLRPAQRAALLDELAPVRA